MELYEAISKRKTTREFLEKKSILKSSKNFESRKQSPTWDHNRNWQFIVLRTDEEKRICFFPKQKRLRINSTPTGI